MMKSEFPEHAGETDWVAELLEEIEPVEPPADLLPNVMARIGRRTHAVRPVHFSKGTAMTKKVFIGMAVAAAIVLAVVKLTVGFPPVFEGAEGTIGAAKRYQAEQITNKDVKLQDEELQAFFQSDTWATLSRDKDAMNALADKDVQRMLAASEVQHALADPAVQHLLGQSLQHGLGGQSGQSLQHGLSGIGGAAFQQLLGNQSFQKALSSPGFQHALGTPSFQKALGAPGFQQGLSGALAQGGQSAQHGQSVQH